MILPDKKKIIATIIRGKSEPTFADMMTEGTEERLKPPEIESDALTCAQDLLTAIEQKSPKAVVEAFKALDLALDELEDEAEDEGEGEGESEGKMKSSKDLIAQLLGK